MAGGLVDALLRKELEDLSREIGKALNHFRRLVLLYALREEPHTVGELCDVLQAPRTDASKHLALLRRSGLVEGQRQGNTVLYSLRDRRVIDAIGLLRQVMHEEVMRRQAVAAPAATRTPPGQER